MHQNYNIQWPKYPLLWVQLEIDMYAARLLLLATIGFTACNNGQTEETGIVDPLQEDKDGDGYVMADDCNDQNESIYPGAPELCEEPLVDSNCDGVTGGLDGDDDGFRACDDCDDTDDTIFPNAVEICDTIDNDCDGQIDDDDDNLDASTANTYYLDTDDDSFGDPEQPVIACSLPDGASDNDLDCKDDDELIHPDADEICDLVDNNCDGFADRNDEDLLVSDEDPFCYPDSDGDGYGPTGVEGIHTCYCVDDEADKTGDCDDDSDISHPEAEFQTAPSKSGDWDHNCDGTVETEFQTKGTGCLLSSATKACVTTTGFLGKTPIDCGETASYLTACTLMKGSTGPYCESTEETRTQACR